MRRFVRISTVVFISIIIGAIMLTGFSKPFGFEIGTTIKVVVMILGTMAFGLLAITWIQYIEKYYDNIIPEVPLCSNKVISLDDIENCIKKEGYIPVRDANNTICFKISGEQHKIHYEYDKFTLNKSYLISEDVDIDLLLKACSQAHDELFMFRSYLHKYDTGQIALSFEVETLVHSLSELERFFPDYLNLLFHSIDRQRELYAGFYEQKNQDRQQESETKREVRVLS